MVNVNTDQPDDEPTQEEIDAHDFGEYLNDLAVQFDALCQQRHETGQTKYGMFTFMENDVLRMMLEELADTVNYARMQAIKLLMLQEQLEKDERIIGVALNDTEAGGEVNIQLGFDAFKGTKDVGWRGRNGNRD